MKFFSIFKNPFSSKLEKNEEDQPLYDRATDPGRLIGQDGASSHSSGSMEMGGMGMDMSSLAPASQMTGSVYYWTEVNARSARFANRALTSGVDFEVEMGDVCFVFPKDNEQILDDDSFISDAPEDEDRISMDTITEILLEIMWKRETPQDVAEGKDIMHEKGTLKYLSDVYDVKDEIDNFARNGGTLSNLRRIVRENVLRSLRDLICCEVTQIPADNEEFVFYKVRLTEDAARGIADESEYLLQMDKRVAVTESLRTDEDFVPPYAAYEDIFEKLPNVACVKSTGMVWTRYDKLSRAMEVDQFDVDCDELSCFRDVDRVRLLKRSLDCLYNFDAMREHGLLESVFVLHQQRNLEMLRDEWANFKKFTTTEQPLTDIRNYFGEEVGLYFAWLGFYTSSLKYPAALGLILYFWQSYSDPDLLFNDKWLNAMRIVFSGFLVGWSTYFFNEWARIENLYKLCWGLETNAGLGVQPRERRQFIADRIVKHPIDPNRWIRAYSKTKLKIRNTISNAVTLVVTLLCVIACNQVFHVYLVNRFLGDSNSNAAEATQDSLEPYVFFFADWFAEWIDIASWVTAILVKICDIIFGAIVEELVAFENHKYENDFLDAMVLKIFFFKALDYFSPLVFVAFFKPYFSSCEGSSCIGGLRSQLVSIFAIDFVSNIFEVGKPAFTYWLNKRNAQNLTRDTGDPALDQFKMEHYEDTVEDFEEMITQFGLVSLFSLVCPVIPLLACLSNLWEIRVDAFKLAACYRRPDPREVQNIGAWMTILQFLTLLVVVMNVALIVFATMGKHLLFTTKLAGCVVMLSCAFAVKEFVQYVWPDDTKEGRVIRSRMALVAHEAIWGRYDKKFDENAMTKMRKMAERDAVTEIYGEDELSDVEMT